MISPRKPLSEQEAILAEIEGLSAAPSMVPLNVPTTEEEIALLFEQAMEGLGPVAPATSPKVSVSRARSKRKLKTLKARIAVRAEPAYRKLAVSRSRAGKPVKKRSEKSRSQWRIDKGRDEKIFAFIGQMLRILVPVRVSASAAHTVRAAKKSCIGSAKIIPKVGLPHWDHADARLKIMAWGLASWELGATPFTLKLSKEIMSAAQSDRKGFGRHLQDRISRHLRERLGEAPPFWFSVEMGLWETPHLHGAIVLPRGKELLVRGALIAAGGKFPRSRQLHFSPKRGAFGWVSYATKWFHRTKAHLRDPKTTGATNPMRAAARNWYQETRKREAVIYPVGRLRARRR